MIKALLCSNIRDKLQQYSGNEIIGDVLSIGQELRTSVLDKFNFNVLVFESLNLCSGDFQDLCI